MKRRWLAGGIIFVLGAVTTLAAREHAPRAAAQSLPLQPHPVVALTFDDLPAAGGLRSDITRVDIATMLTRELRANRLKGVYGFVNAVDLGDDPDAQQALRIWISTGMNIGNHTWSHPSLSTDAADGFVHDIALDEPALRQYAGRRDWHWFRYPYLEEGSTMEKRNDVRDWLHKHGYRIAEVTLNFNDDDWDDPYLRCMAKHDQAGIAWLQRSYLESAAELIPQEREDEQIAFGHEIPNVLLLHATEFTTLMLPDLMHLLKQQGFRFAGLPRVEKNPAYALDPAIDLRNGGSLVEEVLSARHLQAPAATPEPAQQLDSVCR
jgi:peptidoglycan-N-acetylglucosamine deacetylase